jgi:hypothetical protein
MKRTVHSQEDFSFPKPWMKKYIWFTYLSFLDKIVDFVIHSTVCHHFLLCTNRFKRYLGGTFGCLCRQAPEQRRRGRQDGPWQQAARHHVRHGRTPPVLGDEQLMLLPR